jgi:uncharacterized protein (TIGR02145 family)
MEVTVYDDGLTSLPMGTPIPWAHPYYSNEFTDSTQHRIDFGLLYSWYSAVGVPEGNTSATPELVNGYVQGICPEGWHIPTLEEINRLSHYDSKDLKSDSYDYWTNPGTNSTRFDSRGAGLFNPAMDRFERLYVFGDYWTTQPSTPLSAIVLSITYFCNYPKEDTERKDTGLSVRCVMTW